MSRAAAKFTQADVERVIRAAKKEGVTAASLRLANGTEIKLDLSPQSTEGDGPKPVERKREIVL